MAPPDRRLAGRPPSAFEHRTRRLDGLVRAFLAALFLVPFAIMLSGSLRPVGLPPSPSIELLPPSFSFGNYAEVFDTVPLARYAGNSTLVAAVAVPVTVLVSSWAGFAIARLPRRPRAFLIGVCIVVLMIPATALLVGRVSIFRALGLTDTLMPLMAPALMGTSPLFVLLSAWSFHRLPEDLFDLAKETGLSPIATWWRVALPLTRGTAAAVAALAFLVTWGNFLDPLIYVYDERLFTLPIGLRSLASLDQPSRPLMLAGAVVATVPVVVVFLLLQRRFLARSAAEDGP